VLTDPGAELNSGPGSQGLSGSVVADGAAPEGPRRPPRPTMT
jgi:hypothetical protein